jgi:hypothetical protein
LWRKRSRAVATTSGGSRSIPENQRVESAKASSSLRDESRLFEVNIRTENTTTRHCLRHQPASWTIRDGGNERAVLDLMTGLEL